MYNPYDLVKIIVNGHDTFGRPVAFDTEPVNMHTLLNKNGEVIRPTKLSSVCPDCGQGIEILIQGKDLSLCIEFKCYLCGNNNNAPIKKRPTMRPNNMPASEANLLANSSKDLMSVESTVDQRINFKESTDDTVELKTASDALTNTSVKKTTKKARKRKPKAVPQNESIDSDIKQKPPDINKINGAFTNSRSIIIDKADGLTEEADLDDTDMIETE